MTYGQILFNVAAIYGLFLIAYRLNQIVKVQYLRVENGKRLREQLPKTIEELRELDTKEQSRHEERKNESDDNDEWWRNGPESSEGE